MYIPNLETMTNDELLKEIANREYWIETLRRGLPYADHGAYSQDLNAIRSYNEEIAIINRKLQSHK